MTKHLGKQYQHAFWTGLFHATIVMVYSLFMALVFIQIQNNIFGEIGTVVKATLGILMIVISVAVYGWLIFFEPLKLFLHLKKKAAGILLYSTIGWLGVYFILFLFGLLFSAPIK